ncbi:MAG: PEP-CTERM sorting domain-containing protein [Akkermansiaceae bacterium]
MWGRRSRISQQPDRSGGNYVRYSGLTAPTFSLFAQPGAGSASAAINGFQIVGHQAIPEPATGMAVIFGGLLLVFRRKRTVKQR